MSFAVQNLVYFALVACTLVVKYKEMIVKANGKNSFPYAYSQEF
jgi:hypothetical protein